jgi:FMN-dependent NADH-azoreductase
MASLLYIETSPRKDRSASIEVARTFIAEYKKANPDDTVDSLDLWKTDLPEFKGEVINAKYAILHGEKHTDEQLKAWKAVEEVIEYFKGADKYLISLPMWNFGIPYKLKHYIDVLVQPTYTFSFTPEEGYKGLVTGKPVAVVYARGGAYGAGSGGEDFDLQKRYMEQVLGFIGFTDIRSIIVEPTLMAQPEEQPKIMKVAKEQAAAMAREF